jgi:hypothetical protein
VPQSPDGPHAPTTGTGYYLIVLAGLSISLGITAATLALVERISGPEIAWNK